MITFIKSSVPSIGKVGAYCVQLDEISKDSVLMNLFLEAVERTPDWKGVEEDDDAEFYPVCGTEKIGGEEYDKYAEEPIKGPFAWVSTTFVTTVRAQAAKRTNKEGQEYFTLVEMKSKSEQLALRKSLSKPTEKKVVAPKTVSPEDAAF